MKNNSNEKKILPDKHGFTLVELIVVLVILAILAAILVPSLTKYIDTARKRSLVTDCRQCVMTAQTLATEQYSSNYETWCSEGNADNRRQAILTYAELSAGTITEDLYNASAQVTYLRYVSGNGTAIIFENGEYHFEEDEASEGSGTDSGNTDDAGNQGSGSASGGGQSSGGDGDSGEGDSETGNSGSSTGTGNLSFSPTSNTFSGIKEALNTLYTQISDVSLNSNIGKVEGDDATELIRQLLADNSGLSAGNEAKIYKESAETYGVGFFVKSSDGKDPYSFYLLRKNGETKYYWTEKRSVDNKVFENYFSGESLDNDFYEVQ